MKQKLKNIVLLYLAYISSWIIFAIPGIILVYLSYYTDIPIGLGFLVLLVSAFVHLIFTIIFLIWFSISNKIKLEHKFVACTFPFCSFVLLHVWPLCLMHSF